MKPVRANYFQITSGKHIILAVIMPILIAALLPLVACTKKADKAADEQGEKTAVISASLIPDASLLWKRHCSGCHSREQLEGVEAADVADAIKSIEEMKGLRGKFEEQELRLVAGFINDSLSGPPRHNYISSTVCQGCHPDHYSQWRYSLHGLAHQEPVYDYYFIRASIETGQNLETFCARCHTPIAVLNGTIPFAKPPKSPEDTARVSKVEGEGLGCDICHLMDGYTEVNNGGFTVKPSSTKFGPYSDSSSPFHGSKYSDFIRSAEYCGTCHNVTHPANGIVLESTYSEWKAGPYAAEGITCLDCHMTDGLTTGQKHPGKAATTGPERDHVSRHYFVGPNMLFKNFPGVEDLHQRSRELLKKAGRVKILSAAINGGKLNLSIEVANTGAGHYLPTGVTEIRELWLKIAVSNAAGKTEVISGGLDEKGNIKPGATIYRTDVLDQNGKSTTAFWRTAKKNWDKRIPPRSSVTEALELDLPEGANAAQVTVELNYRSVPPWGLAEVDAPEGIVELTIFTISSDSVTLD
jgi:hypothetical protein